MALRGAESPGHLEAVDAREADVADDGDHARPLQQREPFFTARGL
jgi:hypothetical protein